MSGPHHQLTDVFVLTSDGADIRFHVYAQKSRFIGENDNVYFWTAAPSPVSLEFIELVPGEKWQINIFCRSENKYIAAIILFPNSEKYTTALKLVHWTSIAFLLSHFPDGKWHITFIKLEAVPQDSGRWWTAP